MADRNGFIEVLDAALQCAETPIWIKPVLLKMRDDHTDLRDHLDWHSSITGMLAKVGTGVLGAIGLAVAWWLLSGGAATIVP